MLKTIHTYFLALSLLFMLASSAVVQGQVPCKTLVIYNNSSETIYPVLETSMTGVDLWLQAYFATTNTQRDLYPHTEFYRVYINSLEGIKPRCSLEVTVPFYSQLAADPSPSLNDQYINWWNGARIYLYDDLTALKRIYDQDQSHVVSPLTPGPSCASPSCKSLKILRSKAGLPLNDPYQLVEYTFANVNIQTVPYQISLGDVDYDISYVDHVYLPVAIEPCGQNAVGYTGTVRDLDSFRKILNEFAIHKDWPHYVQTPSYPHIRLPGTYNLFIGVDLNTQNSGAKQKMEELWTSRDSPLYQKIRVIEDLFNKNYQTYLTFPCDSHLPLTLPFLLQHIYGWVPFNENPAGVIDNALYNTPGVDYTQAVAAYQALQYSYLDYPKNPFNPYVELIHGEKYLNMQAYAFSIDDAVGNINTPGSGIIIAIGGSHGLPNPNPY